MTTLLELLKETYVSIETIYEEYLEAEGNRVDENLVNKLSELRQKLTNATAHKDRYWGALVITRLRLDSVIDHCTTYINLGGHDFNITDSLEVLSDMHTLIDLM